MNEEETKIWYAKFLKLSAKHKEMLEETFDSSLENIEFSKILEITESDEDSLIIDLGANLGQQIDDIIKIGAEVHAFEPHPIISEFLEKKYEGHSSVIVKKAGAGVANDSMRFFYKGTGEEINGGASLLPWKIHVGPRPEEKLKEDSTANFAEVPVLDIGQYINDLDKQVKILKIDIEGFEYEVLQRLLSSSAIDKIDYILFEDHADCFSYLPWYLSALTALYQFKTRNPATKVFMWKGSPNIEAINVELEDELKRMLGEKDE